MTEKPPEVTVKIPENGTKSGENVSNKNKENSNKTSINKYFIIYIKIQSSLDTVSDKIQGNLQSLFEIIGKKVASNPLKIILTCIVFAALCGIGIIRYNTELRPFKLWLPQNSDFIKTMNWQLENFPITSRRNQLIYKGDNVLTKPFLLKMLELRNLLYKTREPLLGKSFEEKCIRIPTIVDNDNEEKESSDAILDYDDPTFDPNDLLLKRRKKRSIDGSLIMSRQDYCDFLSDFKDICHERSILEIWNNDPKVIESLTDIQILNDVNQVNVSKVFGYKTNFKQFIGGVSRDANGNIISAKSAMHYWFSEIDSSEINNGSFITDTGNGQIVDESGFRWESHWTETISNFSNSNENFQVFVNAANSFGIISEENIYNDVKWLALGSALMFIFVNVNLGRRNLVEQRPLLSLLGLFSIGMTIAISYGICSAFKIPFCPVNSIIPIILLGLGVDDMFIIMAAWEEAKNEDDLIKRASLTMKHAGVAISVTSLTDFTAFLIGASTNLPALRSFCLYAAVGIIFVYIFQITFFLSCVILDERRLKKKSHGCFWFYEYSNDWTPSQCSQTDLLVILFDKLGNMLMKTSVRILAILISLSFLGFSIFGCTKLHKEFNPYWFIPRNSSLNQWYDAKEQYFSHEGEMSFLFISDAKFPEDLIKIQNLLNDIGKIEVVNSISFWNEKFQTYIERNQDYANKTVSAEIFYHALSLFLHSTSGGDFLSNIRFNDTVNCHNSAPPISVLRIPISLKKIHDANLQMHYHRQINDQINDHGFKNNAYFWGEILSVWETNKIVGIELVRNLILSIMVIGCITLLLLSSFMLSILVMACVLATLCGVGCTIWLLNLTIDTVSCLTIVLSVGLSVDYAVHIAHGFLTNICANRTSKETVKVVLKQSGPAVFQGGFSTILSFALLFSSSSHVFQTFFKIFTSSAIIGLYYGIIILPVVLSFLPKPAFNLPPKIETDKCVKSEAETKTGIDNTSFDFN